MTLFCACRALKKTISITLKGVASYTILLLRASSSILEHPESMLSTQKWGRSNQQARITVDNGYANVAWPLTNAQ
jgi:hypothetical protein